MTRAPSEDSDQPGHPPSLIRVFAVRMKKHWALYYLLSAQRRLWSDWPDTEADPSLRWAYISFCLFCRAAAHISRSFGDQWAHSVLFGIWTATWQTQKVVHIPVYSCFVIINHSLTIIAWGSSSRIVNLHLGLSNWQELKMFRRSNFYKLHVSVF